MAEADEESYSRADLQLDFDALAAATVADRGEVWLLQWLKRAEDTITKIDEVRELHGPSSEVDREAHLISWNQDDVRAAQADLEKTLLRLVSQSPPPAQAAPKPGRPARNIAARIFVRLCQQCRPYVSTRPCIDARKQSLELSRGPCSMSSERCYGSPEQTRRKGPPTTRTTGCMHTFSELQDPDADTFNAARASMSLPRSSRCMACGSCRSLPTV